MSPYTEIDYVVADGVAALTLDRPARMNAFTGVMADEIAAASARFGFVFARRGTVPEAASSWFLPRLLSASSPWEAHAVDSRLPPAPDPRPHRDSTRTLRSVLF